MVGLKKSKLFLIISLSFVFLLFGCNKNDNLITIGITQIVEHNALDKTREGFIDGLASRGFVENENVKFIYRNAQGDNNNANLIAQQFASKKVDLIMAISTTSAQAAKNATKKIPIVFSAVTDPVSAKLVTSNEIPGGNITGTSDMSPIEKQFELMKLLFPEKKKIGVVYNTSEPNSKVQVDIIKEIANKENYKVNVKGVTTATELTDALTILLNDIDILLIPTDNLMASSMPIIASKAATKNVPVIGTEKGQVESGALITEGIDYYNLGFQTGLMAADILEGKCAPKTMSVQTLKDTTLVVNTKALESLNITLPEVLRERAQFIGSGE